MKYYKAGESIILVFEFIDSNLSNRKSRSIYPKEYFMVISQERDLIKVISKYSIGYIIPVMLEFCEEINAL